MKLRRKQFLTLTIAVAFLTLASLGLAATRTVSQSGGADYGTINDALTTASVGDIIEIQDSATYTEDVTIATNDIQLNAAAGQTPTLVSGANSPTLNTLYGITDAGLVITATGVQVNGLTVQAAGTPPNVTCTLETGASVTIVDSQLTATYYTLASLGNLTLDGTTVGGGASTNVTIFNFGTGCTIQNSSVVEAAEFIPAPTSPAVSLFQGSSAAMNVSDSSVNFFSDGNSKGILCTGPDGGVLDDCGDVNLTNVTMTGAGGASIGIELADNMTLTLDNTTVTAGGYGIIPSAGAPDVVLQNGSVLSNHAAGMEIRRLGSLQMTDSSVQNNSVYGIAWSALVPAGDFATTLTNCTVTGNAQGIQFGNDNVNFDLYLDNTSVSNNTANGIYNALSADLKITAVNGCQFNSNASRAFRLEDAGADTIDVSLTNATLNSNGNHAIAFQGTGNNNLTLDTVTADGNGGNGLVFLGGACTLTATDSTVSDSGAHGLNVGPSVSSLDIDLTRTDFTGSVQYAMNITGTAATFTATDCDFTTNTALGVLGTPVTQASLTNCRAYGNGGQNYYFGSLGAGACLTVDGGYSLGAGIGFNLGGTGGAGATVSFSNHDIQNSTGPGIHFGVQSNPDLNITNCNISQNATAGLNLVQSTTVTLNGSHLDNNNIGVEVGNAVVAEITATDSTIDNNLKAGYFGWLSGGGCVLNLVNSSVSGNDSDGSKAGDEGGVIMGNNAQTLTLDNSNVDNNKNYGMLAGVLGVQTLTMTNGSSIDGNEGRGVELKGTTNNITIDGASSISNSGSEALYLRDHPGFGAAAFNVDVSGNSTFDGNYNFLTLVDEPTAELTADISDATITNSNSALNIDGDSTVTLTNCTLSDFTGVAAVSLQKDAAEAHVHNHTFTGCTVTRGNRAYQGLSTLTLNLTLDDTEMSSNTVHGLEFYGDSLDLTMVDSHLDNNGNWGVLATGNMQDSGMGSLFKLDMTRSTINNNPAHNIQPGSFSVMDIDMADASECSHAGNYGLLFAGIPGTITIDVADSALTSNTIDGINLPGNFPATVNLTNADLSLNRGQGVQMAGGGTLTATNTDFSSWGQGMSGAAADWTVTLDGCTFANSNWGINAWNGTVDIEINATDTDFTNINQPAINSQLTTLALTNCTLDNCGQASNGQMEPAKGNHIYDGCTFQNSSDYHILTLAGAGTLTATDCVFGPVGANVLTGGPSWSHTFENCEFQTAGNIPINPRGGPVTIKDSTFTGTGTGILASFNYAIDGSDPTLVLEGCDISGLGQIIEFHNGSYEHAPDPNSDFYRAINHATLKDCDISLPAGANGILFVSSKARGETSATLVVDGCDVRITDPTAPGADTFCYMNQPVGVLQTTVTHSTFSGFDNAFVLASSNTLSSLYFDQCDFTTSSQATAIWLQATAGGTCEVVDTIFKGTQMHNSSTSATLTEDYNLFDDNGTVTHLHGAITSGENSVNAPVSYSSETWGDELYLFQVKGTRGTYLNSGNGPEQYAGAKGIDPSASAGPSWTLY